MKCVVKCSTTCTIPSFASHNEHMQIQTTPSREIDAKLLRYKRIHRRYPASVRASPAGYRVQTNLTKWKSRGLLCTKCILILTQNLYKILDVINGFTVSLLFCLYCISILYITNKSKGISLKCTQFVLIYHYIVKYHGQSKTPKFGLSMYYLKHE